VQTCSEGSHGLPTGLLQSSRIRGSRRALPIYFPAATSRRLWAACPSPAKAALWMATDIRGGLSDWNAAYRIPQAGRRRITNFGLAAGAGIFPYNAFPARTSGREESQVRSAQMADGSKRPVGHYQLRVGCLAGMGGKPARIRRRHFPHLGLGSPCASNLRSKSKRPCALFFLRPATCHLLLGNRYR
jgi:hypothetical protein